MISIPVRFLGGLRDDTGASSTTLSLPSDATVGDLGSYLRTLGIEPETDNIIITLNSHGLRQWPLDRRLAEGDTIAVFPAISGGQIASACL